MLCENGEFKRVLADSPGEGFYIECMRTYSKGFIIAGDKGQMMVFMTTGEPNNPYTRIASLPNPQGDKISLEQRKIIQELYRSKIKSMDLSAGEDTLILTTDRNQIFKMAISLLDNKNVEAVYDYLVHPFHSRGILGMDVCVKKNLIATCSMDKTVKIWSYTANSSSFNLEIDKEYQDEAFCVAFHPSGFQIVVGFADKIRLMNVFQDNKPPEEALVKYDDIQIKQCREIVFSNGGHLFACQNGSTISIYKFFTVENPMQYIFKAHLGLIRSISWLEDDTGFISSGWDASIYMWKLNLDKDE